MKVIIFRHEYINGVKKLVKYWCTVLNDGTVVYEGSEV